MAPHSFSKHCYLYWRPISLFWDSGKDGEKSSLLSFWWEMAPGHSFFCFVSNYLIICPWWPYLRSFPHPVVMLTQGSGFLIKNHALSSVLFKWVPSFQHLQSPKTDRHHRHSWQLTVLSFCGYRILLNLQKLAKKSSLTRTQDSWALSSLHYTSPNHTTSGTLTVSYELTSLNASSSASRSKTTRPEADIEMVPRTATGAAWN